MDKKNTGITQDVGAELNRLHLGDCIAGMRHLPDASVDAIITDPPYNISRDNNYHTMGRAGIDFGEWDKNFDQTAWLNVALPKVKTGGAIIIFNDWMNLGFIGRFLETNGCEVKDFLQWKKTNPMPRNRDRRYVVCAEYALWAIKGKTGWKFNRQRETYETGIFEHPVVSSKERIHPTQKAVALMEDIIKIHTNAADVILDPFSGSASTAIAALNLGRYFIGFESDEVFYKAAYARLAKVAGVSR